MKPSVPIIVAKVQLENQTTALPFTDFFTTPDGGNFRISIYAQANGPNFSASVVVAWQDSLGNFGPFGVGASIGAPSPGAMFHVPPGVTFKYTVSGTPPSGSTYNFYITLESLDD